MLKTRNKSVISLREEIGFLQSYLYLLHIRFGDAFRTIIKINDRDYSSLMPACTLQLLAENAVKHNGISTQNPLVLTIESRDGELLISNNLIPKKQHSASSGIGLQNIQSRYHLLFNKEISIQVKENSFIVSLPLIVNHENLNHRRRSTGSMGFETNHTATETGLRNNSSH
jgi:LytS/YehU family sensor histidine kinase